MSHREAYLAQTLATSHQMDYNPDWSRRARGFATYAALRQLGRSGVAALIERCCDHVRALARGLASLPHVELIAEPIINQALVRFRDPRRSADDSDHDRRTDQVIEAINA